MPGRLEDGGPPATGPSGGGPRGPLADAAAPGRRSGLRRRLAYLRWIGRLFRGGATAAAVGVVLLAAAIALLLAESALPSIHRFGWGFLWASTWSFTKGIYGGGPAIFGTLLTSGLALLLAVPVALGVAVFAAELAPRWLRIALGYAVDLGAMVPSVVYGIWGLTILVPFMERYVEPPLIRLDPHGGLFGGPAEGVGVLTAGVILAIMAIPTIAALSREALRAVPREPREAARALGATRWETTRIAVIGPARRGIVGAIVLGLGRALGETIAVVLVIGNICVYPRSVLAAGCTIPTTLVNYFGSSTGLQLSSLFELGLILLGMSLAINLGARLLLLRSSDPEPDEKRRRWLRVRRHPVRPGRAAPGGAVPTWWAAAVARRPTRLRWRRLRHSLWTVVLFGSVVIALYPLASILRIALARGGAQVVRPSFYTASLPPACLSACSAGGIGPAIEGTFLLVGLAAAIALPVGLLAGIYLSEYGRRRFGAGIGVVVDALLGVPTLLIGVFVFSLFLRYDRPVLDSVVAGGFALSLVMLPIVVRTTESALATVPRSVRESALALGFPRHRITTRVVLGSCRSALVTGSLLATGRAAGETAALLFTLGWSLTGFAGWNQPIAAITPFIYQALSFPYPNWLEDAWGATLVLLLIMLGLTIAARYTLGTDDAVATE